VVVPVDAESASNRARLFHQRLTHTDGLRGVEPAMAQCPVHDDQRQLPERGGSLPLPDPRSIESRQATAKACAIRVADRRVVAEAGLLEGRPGVVRRETQVVVPDRTNFGTGTVLDRAALGCERRGIAERSRAEAAVDADLIA
jgi:hypothetical protein